MRYKHTFCVHTSHTHTACGEDEIEWLKHTWGMVIDLGLNWLKQLIILLVKWRINVLSTVSLVFVKSLKMHTSQSNDQLWTISVASGSSWPVMNMKVCVLKTNGNLLDDLNINMKLRLQFMSVLGAHRQKSISGQHLSVWEAARNRFCWFCSLILHLLQIDWSTAML